MNEVYLGDVCANKSNTLSAGFYEQGPGPLKYTYTYDEAKVVLEGELHIKDTTTGETFVATPGKVLNISNGAALEFTAPTKAKVFVSEYCRSCRQLSQKFVVRGPACPTRIGYHRDG